MLVLYCAHQLWQFQGDYELGGASSVSVFVSSGLCVVSAAVREQRSLAKIAIESPVDSPLVTILKTGYQKMRSAFALYVLRLNRELKTNLGFSTATSGS